MRVVIIGAGAIGTTLGLALAGRVELAFLLRPGPRAVQLHAQGLCVLEKGRKRRLEVPLATTPHELPPPELVVLCVKSYDTAAALDSAAPLMAAGAKLLCLQNGLGNCEQAAARFGAERVLYGGTSQGAYLDRNGVLQRMGEGRWRLAAIGADADAVAFVQDLVSLFARAGLQAEEVGDWRRAAWEKAAVNAVINPLTALLNAANECILKPDLLPFVYALCQETALVFKQEGLEQSASELVAMTLDTAQRTAHNRSSMRADFIAGRPLELEAINGEILRRGQAAGLSLPSHTFVLELLREHAAARQPSSAPAS